MNTPMSKRAFFSNGGLSAGLGIGALALLTQRAAADTPFTSVTYPVTGGTVSRTTPDRFADIVNVREFGAKGDGATDDTAAIQAALNAAYGLPSSPNGGPNATNNRAVFFPNGDYRITTPLRLRSVRGAHIFGAGRFATRIQNVAGGSVFQTNGCEYSRFERMNLATSGTGVAFDLDWDGTGSTALQSNTFSDMYIEGGTYGVRIGQSGYMGSENSFLNCYFAGGSVAGLATKNYNALQQSVIGGNIAGCAIGIWVYSGSVPVIHGVGFQTQSDTDIAVDNTAGDCYAIHGCRSESVNFIRFHNGSSAHLAACTQTQGSSGVFAFIEAAGTFPGSLSVDNCYSLNGILTGNGKLYARGNFFGNSGYLSSFAGKVLQNI